MQAPWRHSGKALSLCSQRYKSKSKSRSHNLWAEVLRTWNPPGPYNQPRECRRPKRKWHCNVSEDQLHVHSASMRQHRVTVSEIPLWREPKEPGSLVSASPRTASWLYGCAENKVFPSPPMFWTQDFWESSSQRYTAGISFWIHILVLTNFCLSNPVGA